MVFWVILETSGILLSVIHELASANGRGEILDTSAEFFWVALQFLHENIRSLVKKQILKSL